MVLTPVLSYLCHRHIIPAASAVVAPTHAFLLQIFVVIVALSSQLCGLIQFKSNEKCVLYKKNSSIDCDPMKAKMGETETNTWLYCTALGILVPILIPSIQFGLIFRIWDRYNKPVNRDMCACSCWDTVFKGIE